MMKSTQLIRRFSEIQTRIIQAQNQAYSSINRELIELYWDVGKYVFEKLESAEWGEKTVSQLADHLQISIPGIKDLSKRGLYRMRQFFDTYRNFPIVTPLVTQITWTHNLIIFSRCKEPAEREFYIRLCNQKDSSVVEYAMSRHISPTLIADYSTKLPDRKLLQEKWKSLLNNKA